MVAKQDFERFLNERAHGVVCSVCGRQDWVMNVNGDTENILIMCSHCGHVVSFDRDYVKSLIGNNQKPKIKINAEPVTPKRSSKEKVDVQALQNFFTEMKTKHSCPICSSREWVLCGEKLPIASFKCKNCGYLMLFSKERFQEDTSVAPEEVAETKDDFVDSAVDMETEAKKRSQGRNQQYGDKTPKIRGFQAFFRRFFDL